MNTTHTNTPPTKTWAQLRSGDTIWQIITDRHMGVQCRTLTITGTLTEEDGSKVFQTELHLSGLSCSMPAGQFRVRLEHLHDTYDTVGRFTTARAAHHKLIVIKAQCDRQIRVVTAHPKYE